MLRSVLLCATLGLVAAAPMPTLAQTQAMQPDIASLSQTLNIDSLIAVMRDEGLANSSDMEADLFPGQGGAAWAVVVDKIYDAPRLREKFDTALTKALQNDPATADAMQGFFGSALGQRIIALEVEARRTLLDDAAVETATDVWTRLQADKAPRAGQIERFAQANDLIESNVMGALNANFAFYRGMAAGGAFAQPMSEADMLAEVWAQESAIRQETADWLYPFLTLAYQPLTDTELDSYIAFSDSAAGKKANAAIFAAFDAMFVHISQELGQSAARVMAGQAI